MLKNTKTGSFEPVLRLLFKLFDFLYFLKESLRHTEESEVGGVTSVNGALHSAEVHKLVSGDKIDVFVSLGFEFFII